MNRAGIIDADLLIGPRFLMPLFKKKDKIHWVSVVY